MERSRYNILLSTVFILAFLFRLYPSIVSGVPFGIDAWPLIRDAYVFMDYSPIDLGDSLLDGYNSFWPGSILFSVVFSLVSCLDPLYSMSFLFPSINVLGIVIFYLILRRLGFDRSVSLASIFVVSSLYPMFFFYAGVTKETYAFPLYLGVLFLTLFFRGFNSYVSLFILAVALVFSHHLTSFMLMLIILYIGLISIFRGLFKEGLSILSVSIMVFIMGYIHYVSLGFRGLRLPELSIDIIISISSYFIVFLFMGYIFSYGRYRGLSRGLLVFSISFIISFLLAYWTIVLGFSEGVVRLGLPYLLYSIPYILLGSLISVSVGYLRGEGDGLIVFYWFLAVAFLLTYSVFGGNPLFTGLVYRLINFLVLPLSIASLSLFMGIRVRIGSLILFIILLLVFIPSFYAFYNAFYRYDSFLGYNWRNSVRYLSPPHWLLDYGWSRGVVGDTVIKHVFRDYFGIDVTSSYRLYFDVSSRGRLYVFYDVMVVNGFNGGSYMRISIDETVFIDGFNRVFDNIGIWMYL